MRRGLSNDPAIPAWRPHGRVQEAGAAPSHLYVFLWLLWPIRRCSRPLGTPNWSILCAGESSSDVRCCQNAEGGAGTKLKGAGYQQGVQQAEMVPGRRRLTRSRLRCNWTAQRTPSHQTQPRLQGCSPPRDKMVAAMRCGGLLPANTCIAAQTPRNH